MLLNKETEWNQLIPIFIFRNREEIKLNEFKLFWFNQSIKICIILLIDKI